MGRHHRQENHSGIPNIRPEPLVRGTRLAAMGIKITGLDEFRRKLERLSRNAQNVNGPVAFDDLFPPEFMRRYTDFATIHRRFVGRVPRIRSRRATLRKQRVSAPPAGR